MRLSIVVVQLITSMREIDGVEVPEATGAFYVYPNVEGLLGRDINGRVATNTSGLAAIILEGLRLPQFRRGFSGSGFLRFSYAMSDDDIKEGISRLQKLFALAFNTVHLEESTHSTGNAL